MATGPALTIDSTQFVEALKALEERQKTLAALTETFGKNAAKAYTQVETAAKQAARGPSAFQQALEANTKALTDFKGQVNQGAEGIGKIASAVTAIDPQLGGLLTGLQKGTGVVAGLTAEFGLLGASLAPILAIAAPLAAGIYLDQKAEEEAAAAAEKRAKAVQALNAVLATEQHQSDDLARSITDYSARYDVVTGATDALAAAHKKEYNELVSKTHALQDTANKALDAAEAQARLIAATKDATDVDRANARVAVEDAQKERQAVIAQTSAALDGLAKTQKAEEDAARGKKALAEATKEATKAEQDATAQAALRLRLLLQEAGLEAKREQDYDKARDALDKIHDATVKANASTEDKIRLDAQAAREAAVSAANEAQAKTSADKEGAADRKRIALELRETLDLINQGEVVDLRKAEEAKTKTAREEAKKRSDTALNYAEDLTGNVSDLLADAADKVGETNEDAGRRLWAASKTIGVLQSTIAAYKAAAETTAAVAAIPGGQPFAIPAGLAMFAAVEGATVAKIAATPPPTFDDTPLGGWKPSQNARSATFAADDTVIAARNPQELIRQAVAATVDRQMARPARRTTSEQPRSATTPTARLLTSDLSKTVRGRR